MVDDVKKKVRRIKASKELQSRVGTGAINEETVKDAQKVIEENDVDFAPIARPHLNELRQAIQKAYDEDDLSSIDMNNFSKPVMNLKANAGSFNYPLISQLGGAVLVFIEGLKTPDKKAIQIIDLLYKTVLLVIAKQMKGDGGGEGKALVGAFQEVCRKYKQV